MWWKIAEATVKVNARYFISEADVPKKYFTQGMGNILMAKEWVLLATGAGKAEAMKALLLNDEVTTDYPCTFLKLYPNAVIYLDQELSDFNCL